LAIEGTMIPERNSTSASRYAAQRSVFGIEIVVVNKTRKEIDQVFISPSESTRWSKDVLGRDVLQNAEQVKLDLSEDYGSTCSFDLKVVYSDGSDAVWSNLDFCKYLTFEIEPRGVVRFSEN